MKHSILFLVFSLQIKLASEDLLCIKDLLTCWLTLCFQKDPMLLSPLFWEMTGIISTLEPKLGKSQVK